jgi:hypothetical protein
VTERRVPSPDGRHIAVLREAGVTDAGAPLSSLTIDRLAFGDRRFGDACLWSPDSRYFAIQEWIKLDDPAGAAMQLLLIDVERRQEAILAGTQGRIEPTAFESGRVRYEKHYTGVAKTREFVVDLVTLARREA